MPSPLENSRDAIKAMIRQGLQQKETVIEVCERALAIGISKFDFYRLLVLLIEEGQIPNVLRCYCGHDCARCTTLHATLRDDDGLRGEVVAFYQNTFGLTFSPCKVHCFSGRSDELMEGCADCPWMACCKKRGLSACEECKTYPCAPLAGYIDKYVNKVNQIDIRRQGA